MANATEADVAGLQEQLQQLRADFAALSETLKELARYGISEATQRATAPGEKVCAEVKHHAETLSQEIEEKPIASAFVALGIGFVLGVLFLKSVCSRFNPPLIRGSGQQIPGSSRGQNANVFYMVRYGSANIT
jgi:ElaB/YqjD/DUF883 family membrane-anchored ribosome-binding protein